MSVLHPCTHCPPFAAGDLPDFDMLLSSYKAVVDWPGAAFYKQLMERYPDAKVTFSKSAPVTNCRLAGSFAAS